MALYSVTGMPDESHRVYVTSFERQLTLLFLDSVKTIHCTEREKYGDLTEQTVHQKGLWQNKETSYKSEWPRQSKAYTHKNITKILSCNVDHRLSSTVSDRRDTNL